MKMEGNMNFNSIIQRLNKSGSRERWLSLLITSILGATGLALALRKDKIGLPDAHVSSSQKWVVSGLQNLGNNCFLNVVLQALASCSRFRKFVEGIIDEYESEIGALPLTSALASLLQELCDVYDKRSVLNPRKVMIAMDHYVPKFNLTNQQDAEEAFFHLLSSLREEILNCYVSNDCSLVDVTAPYDFRILSSMKRSKESEQQRWHRSYLGPFDGTIGSILSCQNCSFQISLNFQLFHSLHIPPMIRYGGAIDTGCSLEDCLSQFFVSEQLENYFCSHCWHVGALKYLNVTKNQADVEKINQCNEDESCDCKNLPSLRSLPWSNSFSRTFKQLIIARSPQILCIHLQRASVNIYGEPVKLLGHISFPLILDLSHLIKRGIKNLEENSLLGVPLDENQPTRHPFVDNKSEHTKGQAESLNSFGTEVPEHQPTPNTHDKVGGIKEQLSTLENGGYAGTTMRFIPNSSNYKGVGLFTSQSQPSREHMYRLVSVVQHFGKVGSGHYTVYRRVKLETRDENPIVLLEPTHAQWFCISDSDVHIVSERDVLGAKASLLFYEKID